MLSGYQQFVKDNYHKCSGTPQEKMKQVATMYRASKGKKSGGLLSGAALPSMDKLKIFKDMEQSKKPYIPKGEKEQQTGGLLSGAGGLGC